ncbi:hypothetical protein F4821DRAFT_245258 [Hypoxylon rubiginosum]|uniref:Uncharacterized protein n=1 Tax=Hypoxylon rubiginosum TaxID=110542 RepID=A0ACC0CS64_9PEZI|nr:hypothetical protein F4821DRAFT_245258 [Hypoxylon rubiginosum]
MSSMLPPLPSGTSKAARLDLPKIGRERWVDYGHPHLDINKVCRALNCHKSFELQAGHVIHDLPKFGGFTDYGNFTEDVELKFCEQEARRLVRIANSVDPVKMQGGDELFGPPTREGYLQLHQVGKKFIHALRICMHDTAVVQAGHYNVEADYKRCSNVKSTILREFDPMTGQERYSTEIDDETKRKYYYALINYTTAILVKVILQTIRGDYWIDNIVAIVARLAAKAKIIGNDLPRAVTQTLHKANDARIQITQKEERYDQYSLKKPEQYLDEKLRLQASLGSRAGQAGKYFIQMGLLYNAVIRMLDEAVSGLAISHSLASGTDDFESSVAIYESFITNEQIILCQQRDGSIGGASEAGTTRASIAGFEVCLKTWGGLDSYLPRDDRKAAWTSIQWKWTQVDEKTGALLPNNRQDTVKLSSMKGVIAATVPYTMISGTFAASLDALVELIRFASNDDDSPLQLVKQPKIICTAILQTSEYKSRRPGQVREEDACPVSESFLIQKRAFANSPHRTTEELYAPTLIERIRGNRMKGRITLRDREKSKKVLEDGMKMLNNWVIDQDVIVVPYKRYAWGSISLATLLVCCGLAVGFSVGDRIPGVDPSNISAYCWVVTAFLLLMAKAICVESWPWSSFLRGNVPCRSVSEVVSVTGIDAQVLLAILLRLDNRMHLRTRGPFNTLFRRKSPDALGGFSIDVPIKTATAIEGGFIPIKVLSDWGTGLVFINTHSWVSYNGITDSSPYNGHAICPDIDNPYYWIADEQTPCFHLTNIKEDSTIHISRVLGVFERDCYFY